MFVFTLGDVVTIVGVAFVLCVLVYDWFNGKKK